MLTVTTDYARALGVRLRAIRTQQGLSLHGVEQKSQGRWKAVVVGSYERGDRAVTVQRLAELADFYGVPVQELLPGGPRGRTATGRRPDWSSTWSGSAGARGEGRTARALLRDDPEPARRLQRPGAVRPSGRPPHAGGHLRPVTRGARRAVHHVGCPGRLGTPGGSPTTRRPPLSLPQTGASCTRHGRVSYTGHRFARVTEGAPRSTAVG